MTILDKWYQLAARMKPQFITKLAFVWWKNVLELFTLLIKQWWALVLALLAAYTGYLKTFLNLIMTGNGLAHLLMVKFATTLLLSIALGMWLAAIILTVHPSMFPKAKDFYRTHLIFFLVNTVLVTVIYQYYVVMPFGFFPNSNPWPAPKYFALIQLYLIFSSFFVLDAHISISEYLRALTILPLKFLLFNLPLTVPLYLVLITINWAPEFLAIMLITPPFMVLCGIVYKLAIDNSYKDYYPNN